ncbi:MAG: right-handed parallel beta-helix repeat-containing protein [Pirellulales bacterium]
MKRFLSALIALFVFTLPALATTYYVDVTTGSDSDDGLSEGNAWQTLSKAASTLAAGDTVYVKASASYTLTSTVTWAVQGTIDAQVNIIGYTSTITDGGQATVTSSTNSVALFTGNNADYYTFKNFNFTHTAGTRGNGVTNTTSQSNPVTFINCTWDGCLSAFLPGSSNIMTAIICQGCEIKNCTATDGAVKLQGGTDIEFIDSYIHANNGGSTCAGIWGDNAMTARVRRSRIVKNGYGIRDTHTGGQAVSIRVHNSTIANNTVDGIEIAAKTGSNTLELRCNVIANNGAEGLDVNETSIFVPVNSYNAWGNNSSGNYSGIAAGMNEVTLGGDPFANAASDDFELNGFDSDGLACMDVGPGGFDLGALNGDEDYPLEAVVESGEDYKFATLTGTLDTTPLVVNAQSSFSGPRSITQSTATPFDVYLSSDSDGTPLTSATITVQLKKAGESAWTDVTSQTTEAEIGNGVYTVTPTTTNTNTIGSLTWRITASGAIPAVVMMQVDKGISVGATGAVDSNLMQMGGNTQSATDLKDFADAGYNPSTNGVSVDDFTSEALKDMGIKSGVFSSGVSGTTFAIPGMIADEEFVGGCFVGLMDGHSGEFVYRTITAVSTGTITVDEALPGSGFSNQDRYVIIPRGRNLPGKVLGSGGATLAGTGARVVDSSGNAIPTAAQNATANWAEGTRTLTESAGLTTEQDQTLTDVYNFLNDAPTFSEEMDNQGYTSARASYLANIATEPLKPTVEGRTLDVTSTGGAGIDFGNVENPTSTVNLSGTTVGSVTDMGTTAVGKFWNALVNSYDDTSGSFGKRFGDNVDAPISEAGGGGGGATPAEIWGFDLSGETGSGTASKVLQDAATRVALGVPNAAPGSGSGAATATNVTTNSASVLDAIEDITVEGVADFTPTQQAQILAALSLNADIGVPKGLIWTCKRQDGQVGSRTPVIIDPDDEVDVVCDFRGVLGSGDAIDEIVNIQLLDADDDEDVSSPAFGDIGQAEEWMGTGVKFGLSGGTSGQEDKIKVRILTVSGKTINAIVLAKPQEQ